MGYREHQLSIAPPWLAGLNGAPWQEEFGGIKDTMVSRCIEAVKASFPGVGPEDALPYIGAELGLPMGSESVAAYRLRLLDAFTTWSTAGSALSLLNALSVLGYTSSNGDPVLVQQNGRGYRRSSSGALLTATLGTNPRITGAPPWWSFDGNTAFWTRFALLFPQLPTGWTTVTNPPAVDPSLETVNWIRRAIAQWKPATRTCEGIYVLTAGHMWGWPTTQKWGDPGLVWGGSTVVRWTP